MTVLDYLFGCYKEGNRADIHEEKPLLLSMIFFIMLSNLLLFFCMIIALSGLKITASQWKMSSQNDALTKSRPKSPLAGHVDWSHRLLHVFLNTQQNPHL